VAPAAAALAAFAVAAATSSASPSVAPDNTSPPTISGDTKEGQTLTAASGTWTGTSPISFAYRWLRCNSSGSGCANRSTGQTYVLGSGDIGHTIRVAVTATNDDGSEAATSSQTAVVQGVPPRNTSPPTLGGRARQGEHLNLRRGDWDGDPNDFDYAWQRCDAAGNACTGIGGETRNSYLMRAEDVGKTLRGVVIAINKYGSTTVTTRQSAVVERGSGRAPSNTSAPTISGTPQQGATLTAEAGRWSGDGSISFRYSWQRCDRNGAQCNTLPANSTRYVPTGSDVGWTIRVAVTGSSLYGAGTAYSRPTAVITGPTPPGTIRLPDGTISVGIENVSLPQRLIVDRLSFSPTVLRSRSPFTVRFRVVDTRGYVVRGALVYVVGVPFGRILKAPEQPTGQDGWVTMTLTPTQRLALIKGGSLVLFVRARRSGDNVLAGVSTRRLVQVRTAPPG
jgi:hypothetical protein